MAIDLQLCNLLAPGEAAADLGVSAERVKQLDAELAPMRTRNGRRVYLESRVHALAGHRDALKAARRARKASR